tara:strand:- start:2086 stop:2943 length:858 start_codon:yes stop_codon:yes gene_type:complete
MIKLFNYLFQSIIIYFFFIFGRLMGLRFSRKFFSYLFLKLGPFFKSKKIIKKNLNFFSNNLSDEKIRLITSSMWKNYGMTFIEYAFLDKFRKGNSHISIDSEKKFENIFERNKQVIFVSGHFANFELMSMEMTKRNIKLATIYRPLNNYFLNPFMEYLRRKFICGHQIKKGINGVRDTINYINNEFSIALMIDQRVSEGESVDFFNKQALTTTLPAQLAIKFKIPVVPVYIERNVQNNFKIEFLDEIRPSNFKNKFELTEKLNQVLEEMISKNPYQWIWTHNRWK